MTSPGPYHSAVKGVKIEQSVPLQRFKLNDSLAFVYDVFDPVPPEFDPCDCFYMEPPYPAGVKVFDKRVGVSGRTYSDIAARIHEFISRTDKPVVLVLSKTVLRQFPTPDQTLEVDFGIAHKGHKTTLAVWNTYLGNPQNTEEGLFNLLKDHNCVGDMFCGYGNTARAAVAQGKNFVVSDYNPLCIGYIAQSLGEANAAD